MQDSENNPPEPSPEPSQPDKPFIPDLSLRELTATWEMLVAFKMALRANEHWPGDQVEAVAMGLNMITRMESQYRAQVEMARAREKDSKKKAMEVIDAQGGKVDGTPAQTVPPVA